MTHTAMPSPVVDGTDAAFSPELLAPRQARGSDAPLPTGFSAHEITEPPADVLAVLELADASDELGDAQIRHAAGALSDVDAQTVLATVSGRIGRAVRLLTGVAAAVAVAAAVLVASPAPRAAAMEAPHPDPVPTVAVSVTLTLTASTVRVMVPVTTSTATRRGYHCASVWAPAPRGLVVGPGVLGRACSRSPRFVVPVTLVSSSVPLGRSTMTVTDDVDPLGTLPRTVVLTARRPSRFGVGTWLPMPQGQLYVSAPLNAWTPSVGRLTPQTYSPVQVQEFVAGRWVVRATLNTGATGVAAGWVYLGGGVHVVRVARQQGANVTATTGTARTFLVPAEVPVDTY